MTALIRYWFKFKDINTPSQLNLGCGVTAYSLNDALSILEKSVLNGPNPPEILSYVKDIDVSTLEDKHVRSNMGIVCNRGIWFPLGYDN